MKLLTSTILLGAASAAITPQQQILKNPFRGETPSKAAAKPVSDAWSKSLHSLSESMKGMTSEGKAIWDEVSLHFPEAIDKATFFSTPKPNFRKPDGAWDYVIKGADVQSVWIENSRGE